MVSLHCTLIHWLFFCHQPGNRTHKADRQSVTLRPNDFNVQDILNLQWRIITSNYHYQPVSVRTAVVMLVIELLNDHDIIVLGDMIVYCTQLVPVGMNCLMWWWWRWRVRINNNTAMMVQCWVWTWLDTVRHENIVIKIIHDSWLIFLDIHRKALSEWHISFHVSYFLFIWCAICSTFWVLDVTVVVFIFLGLCAAAMSKSTTYRTIDQLTDLELVSCDKLCLSCWLGPTKKWLPKMLDVTTWCNYHSSKS